MQQGAQPQNSLCNAQEVDRERESGSLKKHRMCKRHQESDSVPFSSNDEVAGRVKRQHQPTNFLLLKHSESRAVVGLRSQI